MHMTRRLVALPARDVLGICGVADRSANELMMEAQRLSVLREHPEEADVLRDKPLIICDSTTYHHMCP